LQIIWPCFLHIKWHHPARGHWPEARATLEQNLPPHQVAQMGRCPFARHVAGPRSFGLARLIVPPDVKQARWSQIICKLWCHLPSEVTHRGKCDECLCDEFPSLLPPLAHITRPKWFTASGTSGKCNPSPLRSYGKHTRSWRYRLC
jgi:hypothetical protein